MQEQNLTIIRTWLIIGTVATMAATFTADLLLPLGIAAGVPYVIAILIAYWLHDTRSTLVIAAVCTLLVLAGYFASPAGGELWKVIVNRGLAIGAIWITTWLSLSAEWSNRRVKINEQKTKAIIDNAVDGMITIDEMGNINAFNPAAEKMFGYSIEEIFGKNIKILMPEPYKSEHDQYLDNYRRSGVRKIIGIGREVEGLRKDGTTFPVELAVSEAQSTEGRVFFGTIRDITERQEAENKLKESEERTRAIVDTAVDGIITIDEQGILGSFNPAAEKMFGYSIDEVIGRNINMLMPEPYHSEHDQYLDNYRRTGVKKIIGIGREVEGLRKDGTTFPVELAISEAQSSKGRLFTGIVRDITERRESEKKLKESEEQVRELLDAMVTRVAQFVQLISQITEGDLSQRIEVDGDDELSQLGGHLNVMTEGLAGITFQIREASVSSLSSLKELEAAVSSQSAGASEQASSVNETSTTLQEIKSISAQTVEKASALGESAERTRDEGSRGLASINQTSQSMLDIRNKVEDIAQTILGLSEQTQQIGEITSMVNKVAEQSKLLALNASIEAAKAGEAGVGFSVVATEVKELAEQSGQATEQVQKILQDIQRATDKAVMTTEEGSKEVDKGIEMTNKAGEVMQTLNDVIQETSIASEQIVAAVRQEGTGIDQIVTAMDDINKVTASFVSATQQTQMGVEELMSINDQLDQSVSVYRLES
jgi:PAS domain S-box-containing protein